MRFSRCVSIGRGGIFESRGPYTSIPRPELGVAKAERTHPVVSCGVSVKMPPRSCSLGQRPNGRQCKIKNLVHFFLWQQARGTSDSVPRIERRATTPTRLLHSAAILTANVFTSLSLMPLCALNHLLPSSTNP